MVRSEIISSLKKIFRSFPLKTQLLLILLVLLLISISSLTIIYSRSEEKLIDKVSDNIDDITKAIQISVEELTYRGDSTERLKSYVDMLNKKGIKEISIISDSSEVIASSDPKKIGTKEKLSEKRTRKKKDLMITARLGGESNVETQRPYNIIMPVSIKGQNIGYILITMILDDYRALQQRNHLKRILSTLFVFSIGIIFSLLVAEKYTEPIKKIADASKKIAEGELVRIRGSRRQDEIGILIRSYNEMVEKLAERMELEEKLKKSERMSLIGQLSSGIAHEIRNPLNFMSLSIGHIKERILEERIENKDDLVGLLDDLIKEIHKVNELIHNFLFLGKPITLRKEWVMPETLLNEVLTVAKDKIRNGVQINLECKEGQPVYCDREFMRICLMNLLLNAIQAIEDKGEITIDCRRDNVFSCISVIDTGSGVSPEEMNKIFEPYYSTKKLGIGIGLAITKRFVEEHGGTITIDSEVGKGTTMRMRIPCNEV
ncbi:sensor histidine kinase [Syntrophorhabdus aromaticivorans]|uniref:sensor histidine kinase n=1 Tax=Syntrophorhabdus aromaticivorans TaxID=328301 RepID=UPI00042114DA|nr:HAMP domain-containing sensor histidine kinase [Syntrophorhabdus aromaticivorans]HBA55239.1 sensor histidine kinase [Syntrophorhabdus aromaticivorans]